jgi:hypothetical protein
VSVASLRYDAPSARRDGAVTARLVVDDGVSYRRDRHRGGILLVDAARTEAVSLDYHHHLSTTADDAGNLATIRLRIPAGIPLPETLDVVVLLDVYPLVRKTISVRDREPR